MGTKLLKSSHGKMECPSTEDNLEGVLRRTWRPALSITGAGGLPSIKNAGNVLRPYIELQLSLRIPPTVDHLSAQNEIERILTKDVKLTMQTFPLNLMYLQAVGMHRKQTHG